ncbi:MAG: hypothetical protein QJR00_07400 [Bacillota bacterium]|nr:hypothetical protein [Bacillota bacterium]
MPGCDLLHDVEDGRRRCRHPARWPMEGDEGRWQLPKALFHEPVVWLL